MNTNIWQSNFDGLNYEDLPEGKGGRFAFGNRSAGFSARPETVLDRKSDSRSAIYSQQPPVPGGKIMAAIGTDDPKTAVNPKTDAMPGTALRASEDTDVGVSGRVSRALEPSSQAKTKQTDSAERQTGMGETPEVASGSSPKLAANLSSLESPRPNFAVLAASPVEPTAPTNIQPAASDSRSERSESGDPGGRSRKAIWVVIAILLLLAFLGFLLKKGYDARLDRIERDQRVGQMQNESAIQNIKKESTKAKVKVTTNSVETGDLSVIGESLMQGGAQVTGDVLVDGNVNINGGVSANSFQGSLNGSGSGSFSGSFLGDGGKLNNVNAQQLDGQNGSFYQNAGNLNAGTIADQRLSPNAALLNHDNQTFTGTNTFAQNTNFNQNVVAAGNISAENILAGSNLSLQGGSGVIRYAQGGFATTLGFAQPTSDTSILFPALAAGNYQVCTNSGNCVGGGGSAPSGADFLTLSSNPSLTNERVFTTGANLQATDGGANNNYTVSVVANPTFTNGAFTGNGYFGGNVGIGTTSPTSQLQVVSSDSAKVATIIRGAASQTADLLQVQDSAGVVLAKISATGNLTVKTTDIQGDLTVAGDINISDATKGYKIANNRILFASDTNSSTLVGNGAGQALLGDGSYNSALGYQALYNTTSGDNNAANGYRSLYSNTTGSSNTALGQSSLFSNTTGSNNTANGAYSLQSNTIGSSNTALGYASLQSNTTGIQNTALGHASLYTNNTGSSNVALGAHSGRYIADGTTGNTTGSNSVFLGTNTKANADNETNQIVIGYNAIGNGSNSVTLGNTAIAKTVLRGSVGIGTSSPGAKLHVEGTSASAIGQIIKGAASQTADLLQVQDSAGVVLAKISATGNLTVKTTDIQGDLTVAGDINISDATKGYKIANNRILFAWNTNYSTLVGNGAGQALLSDGNFNSALGYQALYSTTSGDNNTANGYRSLYSNTTGSFNNALGQSSLFSNTTGINNNALGYASLLSNTTGTNNVALGHASLLSNTTGSNSTANGAYSLYSNTTGSSNTANGRDSLYSNTTGTSNTASGQASMQSNTTGIGGAAYGYAALFSNTTGHYNTGNGYASLYSNITGSNNTALGYYSGRYIADGTTGNTTGNNSVFLGASTKANADGESNQIVIGYNATGNGSNSVTLGSTAITKTVLQGSVGIGEIAPSAKLSVTVAGTTTYSSTALSTTPTSSDGLIIKNSDDTSINNFAGIMLQNKSTSVGSARIALTGGNTTSALTFQVRPTAGGATTQEFMRINSDGNVGIGTASPVAKLHVQGSDAAAVGQVIRGAASQTADLLQIQNSSGTTLGRITASGSISSMGVGIFGGLDALGTTRLSVSTNTASTIGQVIRGATSQTADLLQVQDSTGAILAKVSATGNLTVKDAEVQGNLVVTGNVTLNGSFITFSSNVRGFNIPVVSASSLAVTFGAAHANTNYAVMCTPSWNTTCYVTGKTATGFILNFGTASGASDTVDWFAPR